jgi:hypothetical protein
LRFIQSFPSLPRAAQQPTRRTGRLRLRMEGYSSIRPTTYREAPRCLPLKPVFIFGTGRCGSTHLQRLISLRTDTWIWGEHDGFLNGFLRSFEQFTTSAPLARNVFSHGVSLDDANLPRLMAEDSARLSWLNDWRPSAYGSEARYLLDRLFRDPLPKGWAEWGFKEILYGYKNDSPRLLLELFPAARSAFAFRQPHDTIVSMLRSWTPHLLKDESSAAALKDVCAERVARWRHIVSYFCELREARGKAIVFVSDATLNHDQDDMLMKLGLSGSVHGKPVKLSRTNVGPSRPPPWAAALIDSEYAEYADELEKLYGRAAALSANDFYGQQKPA